MSILKLGTIQECEEALESTLSKLRTINSSEVRNLPGLEIIAPAGFRPVVELRDEDGRKKRRTASADNWSPSSGEIRIYFEPANDEPELAAAVTGPLDQVLPELLKALRDAEGAPNRSFVALKWFRDEYLPSTGLTWAQNEEQRRTALSAAIQDGWILTSKVPNPKQPLYATTTIRSNRQKQTGPAAQPASRFRPVPVAGEPLSSTILRDRGSR